MDGLRHAHATSASPDAETFDSLISNLLDASRALADLQIGVLKNAEYPAYFCAQCKMVSLGYRPPYRIPHTPSCTVGRVIDVLNRIAEAANPIRKETLRSVTPSAEPGPASRICSSKSTDADASGSRLNRFDEPWTLNRVEQHIDIFDNQGCNVLPLSYEEFERIVACVNFCAGIATEILAAQPPMMDVNADLARRIASSVVLEFGGAR